jgi:predicted glutamine amidotransferase
MCRLFALRSTQPTQVGASLMSSTCSLQQQSCGDRRGECHDNGWGIGWYPAHGWYRVRSPRPAQEDPRYRALAASVLASTVLAHVRQASVGALAEHNTHPFMHGPWMFAHNGTLHGFAQDPERLRRLIPTYLRQCIQGETDSEHAFYFLLSRLDEVAGSVGGPAEADVVSGIVGDSIRTLADLFPGEAAEPSLMNFVLTDGRVLVASRWGHTLFWLERRGLIPDAVDGPVSKSPEYRALAIASEPTTTESGWVEVPERSVLRVHPDLTHAVTPVGSDE